MATLDKAEALLEDLRSASWDAAVKDLDEVKAFAAKQVCCYPQVQNQGKHCSRKDCHVSKYIAFAVLLCQERMIVVVGPVMSVSSVYALQWT